MAEIKPNLTTVSMALVTAYDGALLSDGSMLTARNGAIEENAIPDPLIPFLSFKPATVTSTPWQAWEDILTVRIPAFFRGNVDWNGSGINGFYEQIDSLYAITHLIKGLPIDSEGKLVPYTEESAARFDRDELQFLVSREGPTFSNVAIQADRGHPHAEATMIVTLAIIANYDPRKLRRAKVVVIGRTIGDPAGTSLPSEWTSATPPEDRDIFGRGRFNEPAPTLTDGEDVSDLVPGMEPGAEDQVEGDDLATSLKSISIAPAYCSVSVSGTYKLEAIALFQDGHVQNISNVATWSSSNVSKATVSTHGTVTGIASGTAAITAIWLGVQSSASTVTVS